MTCQSGLAMGSLGFAEVMLLCVVGAGGCFCHLEPSCLDSCSLHMGSWTGT